MDLVNQYLKKNGCAILAAQKNRKLYKTFKAQLYNVQLQWAVLATDQLQ